MPAMDQNEGGHGTTEDKQAGVAGGSFGSTGSDKIGSAAGGFSTTGLGSAGGPSSGDSDVCPHCGQPVSGSGGLDQFLGRLGITGEVIDNLKGQFQNVDIDEYMGTAREFLENNGGKAGTYAKENPGKVVAGVAALAFGAGLIWSQCRAKQDLDDRARQLELKQALRGPKYRLDEVLRELDVTV